MSQYPGPYGYGQYNGHAPQYLYPYQSQGTYQTPVYASPTEPGATDTHYAMAHNAFSQNASRIPGLGVAGMPNSGSPYSQQAGMGTWDQGQSRSFSAGAPGSAAHLPVAAPAPGPFQPEPRENFPSLHDPAPTPARPPGLDEMQKRSNDDDMEEGELSEGQFEDLYEPKESASHAVNQVLPHKEASNTDPSRGASVVDTPEAGFYVTEEDEAVPRQGDKSCTDEAELLPLSSRPSRGPTSQGRDRSGSYSPYLSPREIQSDRTPNDGHLSPQAHQPLQDTNVAKAKEHIQTVPGLQHATSRGLNGAATVDAPSPDTQTGNGLSGNQQAFKSLDEAKKEAQKAILRLWPLGVKYQHYLDEGFDEHVIKSLFEALHLDISTGKPKEPEPRQPPPQNSVSKPTDQAASTSKSPTPAQRPKPGMTNKSEERKDRIARLLAAKSAKIAPSPPVMTTSIGRSAPAEKPKTREEKELLLQQKMEALRKSRESRAQKAVSDKDNASSLKPDDIEPSIAATSQPVPDRPASIQHDNTGISRASSASPPKEVSPESSPEPSPEESPEETPKETPQTSAPIPGLFLSTSPQPNGPTSQRKRPVALDFVDYPSIAGPVKRPFGQERQDSSLVIDVSDGSDEEMDIDMDEDSPTEPFATLQSTDSSSRRGLSIRDFPPLTDTSQRQYSSPAPSSQTPPTGFSIGGMKRETELDRKERAIQEMRRKIAEAEAKRKAKKPSVGSQTPSAATITPPELKEGESPRPPIRRVSSMGDAEMSDAPSAQLLSEAVSAKLPKPSEMRLRDGFQADHRGRVASLDILRIDGTLQEKMNRLKHLREEEARLQAEIDASLAEKSRLADEMNQLDEETVQADIDASLAEKSKLADVMNQLDEETTAESSQESGQHVETGPDETRPTLPMAETYSPAEASAPPSEGACLTSDGPLLEDEAPNPIPTTRDQSQPLVEVAQDTEQGVHQDDARFTAESHESATEGAIPTDAVPDASPQNPAAEDLMNSEQETAGAEVSTTPADDDLARESANLDTVMSIPTPTKSVQEDNKTPSDSYEPPEPMEYDATDHVTTASSPFSPAPAASNSTPESGDQALQNRPNAPQLPTQISSVTQPREAIQEIEAEPPNEVPTLSKPNSESTFLPYESPLQSFRAYRFHRDYRSTVPGGLKSLTYSNRIDPNKQLCPFDLSNQPCPQGESCQFQHFKSIAVPDDQILLELGKADDYTGEQKNRFIQGLRELLQNFRANKIRDFETIAAGIIDFRSRFLGDESKVLQLEGVTI